MKIIITVCLLYLVLIVKAQTIELNYQPKGVIILFNFNKLKIYTDTTGVFGVVSGNWSKDTDEYDRRTRNLILGQIKKAKIDTISFSGNTIPFNDGVKNGTDNWSIGWIIIELTKKNKLVIFDKKNRQVKTINLKKKGNYSLVYKNKRTGKKLFEEQLDIGICTRFY